MEIEPTNQYSPNQTRPMERTSDSQPGPTEKPQEPVKAQAMGSAAKEDAKGFGPDYILTDSLKPKEVVGGVPFAPIAAAQTLAALPPIHPLGTEALTELSLQKMMQPRHMAG